MRSGINHSANIEISSRNLEAESQFFAEIISGVLSSQVCRKSYQGNISLEEKDEN